MNKKCAKTLLKKNLGRFAPVWVLYTLGLLLLIFNRSRWGLDFTFAMAVARQTRELALWNFCYAGLIALLLWGDLYDARMCSGLHSLPLKRDSIYGVQLLSGLAMNLIPTGAAALMLAPMLARSGMVNGAMIGFWWFAAMNLEFLVFFGMAAFCAQCVGNRLAMAVVYGILNFGSVIALFLASTMIEPMFLGVNVPEKPFILLSPVPQITENRLLFCENHEYTAPDGSFYSEGTFRLDGGWGYLMICVAIAALLILAGFWLYRRRKLECAGDFAAFPALKPVMLVLISLCAGAGFQMVYSFFVGYSQNLAQYLFGAVGLCVGWFAGSMVMERTARVFSRKRWAGLGLLWLGVALCLGLAALDPLGIESRIPQVEDVKSVTVEDYAAESPEEIEKIRRLHALALEQNFNADFDNDLWSENNLIYTELHYELKNGKTLDRHYYIQGDTEAGKILGWVQSRPENLFGEAYGELSWIANIRGLLHDGQEFRDLTPEQKTALMEAVRLDSEEGTLGWHGGLHPKEVAPAVRSWYLELDTAGGGSRSLNIYADSRHCLQWLKDTGIEQQLLQPVQEGN